MKLKTLGAICKRDGVFHLCDNVVSDGEVVEQWLGSGNSLYLLSGLPYLNEENLIALFDITEKQKEKLTFNQGILPTGLSFENVAPGEIMLDKEPLQMNYNGKNISPLITSKGIEFINNDYLAPLADIADEMEIYERPRADGTISFVVKVGFMIKAVILPMRIINELFVKKLETIAVKCRAAFDIQKAREDARNCPKPDAAEGQMSLEELQAGLEEYVEIEMEEGEPDE